MYIYIHIGRLYGDVYIYTLYALVVHESNVASILRLYIFYAY